MGELKIKDKEIVTPGEVIATGMDYLPSGDIFRDGEDLVASRIGLINISGRVIKLIPLAGVYMPKRNDLVIGKVVEIGHYGWKVDFGWSSEGTIQLKEGTQDFIERNANLSRYYDIGDYVIAQVINALNPKMIDLSMKGPGLRRLGPGRLINITSVKVPRVVGKQGSMISMIKQATDCKISVGQNGLIWLSGLDPKKEEKAVAAIMLIEKESHISGLTERVKEFLEK